MTDTVSVPLWVLVLLIVAATLALVQHLLLPGLRTLLRGRVNRVIDEVNTRLNIGIRPFQLTKRQVLIDRLTFDPLVIETIEAQARETQKPRTLFQAEVMRYAREIVPAFNAYIYFRIGYWLANRFARFLYRVRVSFENDSRLSEIDSKSTVVFVMNHRSNMDYVLVSVLASQHSALSYAVGEWARIWPLQQLVRAMGAFFVRRNSNNPLYRRVLERYVHMATQEGVPQAVFLEGGLSRDGHLRTPKLGMLDYMLRGFDCTRSRDIVFVPVGVNYDRVLEDRTLVRALDPHAPHRSRWFVIRTSIAFIMHNLWLIFRNRWLRFGYAAVRFGVPMSMRDYCQRSALNLSQLSQEVRFVEIEKLADHLMTAIGRQIPVVPTPAVAATVLAAGEVGADELSLKAGFYQLVEKLRNAGKMVVVPTHTQEHTFETALDMLLRRRFVVERNGKFHVNDASRLVLEYYANSIGTVQATSPS